MDTSFLQELLPALPIGLIVERSGRIDWVNREAGIALGLDPLRMVGQPVDEVLHLFDPASTTRVGGYRDLPNIHAAPSLAGPFLLIDSAGKERHVDAGVFWLSDSNSAAVVLIDRTEQTMLEARARWLGNHDPPTGLPSCSAFQLELAQATTATSTKKRSLVFVEFASPALEFAPAPHLLRALSQIAEDLRIGEDVLARIADNGFGLLRWGGVDESARYAQALCASVSSFEFVWEARAFRTTAHATVLSISGAIRDAYYLIAACRERSSSRRSSEHSSVQIIDDETLVAGYEAIKTKR